MLEVAYDFFFAHYVGVPGEEALSHTVCYLTCEGIALGTFFHVFQPVEGLLDDVAVVAVFDLGLWCGHGAGALHDVLLLDNLYGVVDVQFEVGNNGEVIPQLGLDDGVGGVLLSESCHGLYDGVGASLTLFSVFDRETMVYHLLYGTPVFFHGNFFQFGVVSEIFHIVVALCCGTGDYNRGLDLVA